MLVVMRQAILRCAQLTSLITLNAASESQLSFLYAAHPVHVLCEPVVGSTAVGRTDESSHER